MNGTGRILRALLALVFLTALAGCETTQPHVTAKVIYQHDDVTAELSTEWRQ